LDNPEARKIEWRGLARSRRCAFVKCAEPAGISIDPLQFTLAHFLARRQWMTRFLSLLLVAGMTAWGSQAIAEDAPASTPGAISGAARQTPPKQAEPAKNVAIIADDDDTEQDITGSTVTEFKCELGNVVTIYENTGDDRHLGIRWLKKIHRLTRIGTSTGANRFENRKAGLVWIGIPAKSMLLDSRKGNQLANECKTAEQMAQKKMVAVEMPKLLETARK
jgi:hypothetical protein